MCSRGSQLSCIVVEDAFKCFVGREFGVKAARPEQVEGDVRLRDEAVPEVEWKGQMCRADGTFGCVTAVRVRWSELVGNVFVAIVGFNCCQGFIV